MFNSTRSASDGQIPLLFMQLLHVCNAPISIRLFAANAVVASTASAANSNAARELILWSETLNLPVHASKHWRGA
jgi:hypothetical protein